ncbi:MULTISPECIES: SHOCT domain-containing protein [unclassified Streptomyces]|uniref:SHOCT domain-containing protein n=1 Tax=unclassified Streptomyces TaxID=2593676 RepID=UPI0027414F27|nr:MULTISPECIES: SHOCT domain-containing protein [unclassified Streptomyces]
MFWFPHGAPGWGWFAMSLGMLLFWVLLIAVAVLLFRALNRGAGQPGAHGGTGRPTAERLLAERFARGEIDEDEYRRRLDVLRQGSGWPGR